MITRTTSNSGIPASRPRRAMVGCAALCVLTLLLGAGCDPTLNLNTRGTVLEVGQRARIKVTSGGDDAALVKDSFTLTDAAGQVFQPGASSDRLRLDVSVVSNTDGVSEVQFTVPPGVTPGDATVAVTTAGGFVFSGTVRLRRLLSVRDAAGKVWVIALTDGASSRVEHVRELSAGRKGMGDGPGRVAVSPDGTLMGSIGATPGNRLWLDWMEAAVSNSYPFAEFGLAARDLAISRAGHTLVATVGGMQLVAASDKLSAVLTPQPFTNIDGKMFRVAAARASDRVVLIGPYQDASDNNEEKYRVYMVQIAGTAGKLVRSFNFGWAVAVQNQPLPEVAISADGKMTVVVNPMVANKPNDATADKPVAFVAENATTQQGLALTAAGSKAVAVAPAAEGTIFYILTTEPNAVVVAVGKGPKLSLTQTISLGSLTKAKGDPVGLAVGAQNEVIVLMEHALVRVDPAKGTATEIQNGLNLFKGNETGASLAIQP